MRDRMTERWLFSNGNLFSHVIASMRQISTNHKATRHIKQLIKDEHSLHLYCYIFFKLPKA